MAFCKQLQVWKCSQLAFHCQQLDGVHAYLPREAAKSWRALQNMICLNQLVHHALSKCACLYNKCSSGSMWRTSTYIPEVRQCRSSGATFSDRRHKTSMSCLSTITMDACRRCSSSILLSSSCFEGHTCMMQVIAIAAAHVRLWRDLASGKLPVQEDASLESMEPSLTEPRRAVPLRFQAS